MHRIKLEMSDYGGGFICRKCERKTAHPICPSCNVKAVKAVDWEWRQYKLKERDKKRSEFLAMERRRQGDASLAMYNPTPSPSSGTCSKCGQWTHRSYCTACGGSIVTDPISDLPGVESELSSEEVRRTRYITSKVKNEVYFRDKGKCVECGSSEELHFDHEIPFSKGGSSTAKNVRLLCEQCNLKKHDKIM